MLYILLCGCCLRRRYDDAVEEGLEAAYKSYLERKGVREQAEASKQAKRARLADGNASEEDGSQKDGDGEDAAMAEAPDLDEEVGAQSP